MRHVSPSEYEKNGPDGDWHRTNVAQLKVMVSGLIGRKRSLQFMFSAENVSNTGSFSCCQPRRADVISRNILEESPRVSSRASSYRLISAINRRQKHAGAVLTVNTALIALFSFLHDCF